MSSAILRILAGRQLRVGSRKGVWQAVGTATSPHRGFNMLVLSRQVRDRVVTVESIKPTLPGGLCPNQVRLGSIFPYDACTRRAKREDRRP